MTARRGRTLETNVSRILQAIGETPAELSDAPALILTIGLPGSGKSTFCRRLAGEIDAVVLESDALRRLLFGEPAYTPLESRNLFAALHAAAHELLEQSRSVIIDATNVRESDRRPAYAIAAETGARLLVLSFTAPEAVIEQRLARRSLDADPADTSTADLRVYRLLQAREEPPRTVNLNIDTSDAVATESAFRWVVEACRPQAAGTARMGGGTP
jgi:hypothetical protein